MSYSFVPPSIQTVPNEPTIIRYLAVGGETYFDYPFKIYDENFIKVIEVDEEIATVKVINIDYTVVGVGIYPGVRRINLTSASYPSGATAGHQFILLLNVPEIRSSDYQQAGDFFADTLNRDLDQIVEMVQQLRRDINRTPTLPIQVDIDEIQLPIPVADNLIGWNSAGDNLENKNIADSGTIVLPSGDPNKLLGWSSTGTVLENKPALPSPLSEACISWNNSGSLVNKVVPNFPSPIVGNTLKWGSATSLVNAPGLPSSGTSGQLVGWNSSGNGFQNYAALPPPSAESFLQWNILGNALQNAFLYKTSTYNPTLLGVSATYTAQYGLYVRVFDLVFFHARVAWSSFVRNGSVVALSLPYNAPVVTDQMLCSIVQYNSITAGGSSNNYIILNNQSVYINGANLYRQNTGNIVPVLYSDNFFINTNASIGIIGMYRTPDDF